MERVFAPPNIHIIAATSLVNDENYEATALRTEFSALEDACSESENAMRKVIATK